MNTKEIDKYKNRVEGLIKARRLRESIEAIRQKAKAEQAWGVADMASDIERDYAYMLQYMAQGASDPDRANVYDGIVGKLYTALDTLVFAMEKKEKASQYYSVVRTRELEDADASISSLASKCADAADKISLSAMLTSGTQGIPEADRRKAEKAQSDLFMAIWTTPQLAADEADVIRGILEGREYSDKLKEHVVSALMLALMQCFDARKLDLLMGAYQYSSDMRVSSAALVGLLLSLWRYAYRKLPRKQADRLAALRDGDGWRSDLRIAFIEMIRARDTERINRKIRDEVIPDMMNLRPEIMGKISDGLDPEEMMLQQNPEWQELLEKSGVADKLKELTEIQMEGGDVMMGTFAHLKHFPFFRTLSNWFLPYDSSHSMIAGSVAKMGVTADIIEAAAFLCDSDKYSFMMALEGVPQEQRNLMASQFQAQSSEIYEALAGQTAPVARRRAVNAYMQVIYRFFKLYTRKGEFFDPFQDGINLITVPDLADDFDDAELLQVVAEFNFKLGYMADALAVFDKLDTLDPTGDAPRYQKMGYCAEKGGDYRRAIDLYRKAELFDADSVWTAKRLAACYRTIGDKDQACKYYRELSDRRPDDVGIAMLLGYVLLEKGSYKEAAKQFYKAEFLDEKSSKPWRALAWTLYLSGDYEGAMRYYDKVAAAGAKHSDYLNMGHVALAMGRVRDAVNNYVLSVQISGQGAEEFLKAYNADAEHIEKSGVDPTMIPLIADAVLYALDGVRY